jgi:hypothetical protein
MKQSQHFFLFMIFGSPAALTQPVSFVKLGVKIFLVTTVVVWRIKNFLT